MQWEEAMRITKYFLQKYIVFAILLALFLIFSLLAPSFLQMDNLMNLLVQSTVLGIVGFGLAVIMIAGEIDLAFAGVVPLEGAIFATLLKSGMSLGLSLLLTFLIGMAISLIISFLVTKIKLVSFVSTIAMMFLLQGVWYSFTGGKNIFLESELNRDLLFGTIGPVPKVVFLFILVFAVLYFITEQTSFGMRMRAVGEDLESSRTVGLNPGMYKTMGFLIGGILFALGAFITTVRMSGALATSGANLLMPVMTVAFVGQTVLGMGRPNVPGVLLASLLLAMINNAFVLMRLPFWSVPMANGIILILAISIANIGKREIIQISM
jgi:ribose/xylose/arabinose/galactoside ABC-type transport system permease subunit